VAVTLPESVELTDGVVLLRRPDERDLAAMEAMVADADVRRWAVGAAPPGGASDALARGRDAWDAGKIAFLAITEPPDDEFLGNTGLFFLSHDFGVAELGYILRPEGRGRGLATRAARLVAQWAFDEFEVARLEARTALDNIASHHVLERLGFTPEGVERSARRLRFATERFDCRCWSLLPGELR
jgi:RimJ/RimL family protein N-acetyltransferase